MNWWQPTTSAGRHLSVRSAAPFDPRFLALPNRARPFRCSRKSLFHKREGGEDQKVKTPLVKKFRIPAAKSGGEDQNPRGAIPHGRDQTQPPPGAIPQLAAGRQVLPHR